MANLKVNIGNLEFKNPVLTASGTFGFGLEFDDFIDVSALGGIIVKGTTALPREGNPYPRMAETSSGMINAVGLQNKGVEHFIDIIYPLIKGYNTHVIVNVNGSTIEDYIAVTEKLVALEKIPAIELNISCPNVKEGGMAFGTSCASSSAVTAAIRKVWPRTLIVKLSPNVTSIAEIAKSVEAEGADAVSLVNTFLSMAINAETRRPVLSTITGGLSGPCIKPIALRMVWQVAQAVKIPVIGLGGIMDATDAIEFLLAGATAVQVGTANFIDPTTAVRIVEGIEEYLMRHNMEDVGQVIGGLGK
ncbi:MAG: dihydroorotate dehydrogenase [Bacteroidetes bacterium]|nr:dihydroorotate dehydrogenase [Bacteroidota bacterium]MBU1718228.1 dihydroorotate dehydrogenase [Bacteroidota bacterium]